MHNWFMHLYYVCRWRLRCGVSSTKHLKCVRFDSCVTAEFWVSVFDSYPDAEMYRVGWKTKVHGSGNHRKPPVCAKGTSLSKFTNQSFHNQVVIPAFIRICSHFQSMGTQEDDVGSKTSSYSWGCWADCCIPYTPHPKAGKPSCSVEYGLYWRKIHKCVEWPPFFFFFGSVTVHPKQELIFVSVYLSMLGRHHLRSYEIKKLDFFCSKELSELHSDTCLYCNTTPNDHILSPKSRLQFARWHLRDRSTARRVTASRSFTQTPSHPSADGMFCSPSSRTFVAVIQQQQRRGSWWRCCAVVPVL